MKKVYNLVRSVLVMLVVIGTNGLLLAEGTKELQPIQSEEYYLVINRSGGLSVPFASYTPNTLTYQAGTSTADYRLNVKLCNNTESVKLGFLGNENGTYYRIKNSAGSVVFGPNKVPFLIVVSNVTNSGGIFRIQTSGNHGLTVGDRITISGIGGCPTANGTFLVNTVTSGTRFTINVPFAGAYTSGGTIIDALRGRIDTWNQAVAGPGSVVGAATGYYDTTFAPGLADDYFIEFNRGDKVTFQNNQITIRFYDVTVVSGANVPILGRLHSKSWYLADNSNNFSGQFFIYSTDGIVTKLANSSIDPAWFSISCNATGVTNTGNPTVDRKSVNGPQLYPSYEIFVNDPDISCYPTGTFGKLNTNPSVSGCGNNRCITINVDKSGNIIILLDLGGTANVFDDPKDRQISYNVLPAQVNTDICIPWDGLDGQGNPIASGFSINLRVDFLNGITHLPLYDCENNSNGYLVSLVRPAGAAPKIFWDDVNITAGTATDGLTNSITGCTAPSATIGCHRWTGRGSNACPPCSETINSWWYANIDTRTVTYINHLVTVDANTTLPGKGKANNSFKSCKSVANVALNGSITSDVAVTGFWTSTGTGTFASSTSFTTTYSPSAADLTAGSVELILHSNPTAAPNSCPSETDTLLLTFVDGTIANAGADKTVCANNSTVVTSGTSKFPATGTVLWSGGAGTYVPNNTTLALTYNPTAAEITAGTVNLTLTVTSTDPTCPSVSDVMTVTINPSPTANAGSDITVCANNSVATLAGVVGASNTAAWTSSSGCAACFSNAASVTSTYTPSATDITNGSVTLTLTSSRAGCTSVTDNVLVTIKPAPTVNAGVAQSKCKNNNVATLAGSQTNTTSVAWTSGSGCAACFSSTTSLTPTYTPSATDLTNGSVTLTLTGSSATCTNVTSTMTITYTASPTINAGSDQVLCANNACFNYNVITTGATGVTWSVGTGTHVPNTTSKVGSYCLSATEVTNGFAALVVNTSGVGNCNNEDDTIRIFINPAPTVNAGADNSVCANNPTLALVGTKSADISTVTWTSLSAAGQQGTFSNSTSINTNYTLSATEVANGTVTLRLSGTAPSCNPVTDDVVITVTPSPTVNAGADQSNVCFNPGTISLNGFSSTGTATWSGGAGTFSSTTNLSATYNSTVAERSGTVTLTLTTTNNGNCNAVSDQVSFGFGPQHTSSITAVVDACANNPDITLDGTSNTSGGQWSGGTGSYSPNANRKNTVYTPTAAEIAAGSVTFTFTPTGTGGCPPNSSTVTVPIAPSPTIVINNGVAVIACAGTPTATLSAVITGATGVTWSGGAGTFSSATGTSVTYTATAAEIASGSVTLTGVTTGNGTCNAVSGTAVINFQPVPLISAGADIVLCGNTSVANLSATLTGATGVSWTHTGTGSLSSSTSLTPTYTPSVADKLTVVTFTATSTGNGTCAAVSDQMQLSFTVVPSVNAGPDMTVCSNAFPAQLNGSGSPAVWTGGAGSYNNASNMLAQYTPTAGEIGTTITLTLTTIPFGACPAVSDQMSITIAAAPIANAGPDQTVCGNAANLTLAGSVSNATGLFWTTTATGSFSNALSGSSTYTPSAADKTAGTVTLTLITTGMNGNCPADSDNVVITITPIVTVFAGPNQTLCAGSTVALTSGVITGATGGTWSQTGGGGTLNNASNLATASYTPVGGDLSVTFTLTTTGNPVGCVALTDQLIITFSPIPTANAGADQSLCSNVAAVVLAGSVTAPATGGLWSSSGAGTFTPNAATLNASYVPAVGETGATTLTLTTTGNGVCPGPYTDQVVITLAPTPTVNAGVNQTVCANNRVVTLAGTVTNATGGMWTTSGDGTFAAAASLATTYTPGATDVTNGTVNLTLTTTGMAPCAAVTDVMVVQITPAPTIAAGPDRSVCANNASISLLATVTVATGGTWVTSGDGTFSGTSANGLTTTYTPGANDKTAGTVTLTVNSTGNGLCSVVSDALIATITPAPTVNAGPDVTICADSFFVKLNATYTVATKGIWTTSGSGSFFNSNATYDTAVYVPSPADRTGGSVTLTFTTTIQGACIPVSDTKIITITPAPTINAGVDQTICSTTNTINITGVSNGVAGGSLWTTSGGGTFVSNTSLATVYNVSAIDKAAGTVILTITSTGNGSCRAVSDQLTLRIIQQATVNAGPDETVCADIMATGIPLIPTVTNQASVLWSVTSGTGVFGPNNTTVNATYFPTAGDTTARTVTVQLQAIANAPCVNVTDTKVITIAPIPVVKAGADQTICSGTNVTLAGSVANASGGMWTLVAPATGSFAPGATTLNASYIPSAADITAGSVKLALSSTGMGTCAVVRDTMAITLRNPATIAAMADFSVCADVESFMLSVATTNAGGVIWTSSGTGGFTPSNTSLTPMYFATNQDSINGTVSFTVTTTGTGVCPVVSDNVVVTLTPVPTIDAGPDVNLCVNDLTLNLNATVTVASNVLWSTTGIGTFDNNNIPSPVYTFDPGEKTGTITFKATSQNNGACQAVRDSMHVTFTNASIVNAGPDAVLCTTDLPVILNGSGSAGIWSILTGDGTLANPLSASTLYNLGTTDSAIVINPMIVSKTLSFRYTPTGTCGGASDDVTITLIQGPALTLNSVTNICTNNTVATLTGATSTAGVWSTSGSGTFLNNNIPTDYTMSAADKAAGSVILTYTIPAGGGCKAFKDTVNLKINPTPTISAGPDKSLCANALNNVTLSGSHTLTGTLQWNILTGGGSLSANNIDGPVYTPVAGDVAMSPLAFQYTINNGICSTISDVMNITITAAPTVTVGIDDVICDNMTAPVTAVRTVASGGMWTSTGTGIFTPNNTIDNPTYVPSANDISTHAQITLTFTTTGNGICNSVSDSKFLDLIARPVVSAGIDDSICSGEPTVTLSGTVLNAPGVTWTTTGSGSFSSNTALSPVYTTSAQDIANGGAIFTITNSGVPECAPVSDFKTLIIVPSPVASVNAGFDQVICRDEGSTAMQGFISVATAAKWDCQGVPCSGTFLPNDQDLFATYIPSSADTAVGVVTLRLTTTTGNGICTPAFDEMVLTITDIPRPNAGLDFTLCADTNLITLAGSISAEPLLQPVAYEWVSSGSGVFAPNAFVQNPTYIPSVADKTNGAVGFTLHSLNNGTCDPLTDAMIVTLSPQPTINAGSDRTTCANINGVSMIGTMSVASNATWTSSGSGVFSSVSANGLNAKYDPSAADDAAGSVILTLTTTGGLGLCRPVSDNYLLMINPAPIVNAGVNQTICADNNAVSLNGTITNAAGGFWRTLGSGVFAPFTSTLNATYNPSDADTTAGTVSLILTSSGNGFCNAEDDTITFLIDPMPIVNPAASIVCRITSGVTLSGGITNALGGLWTTSGTGSFSTNAADMAGKYFPTLADSIAGVVTLTLTSTGNGVCNAVQNTVNLSILPVPIAVASPDQFVCAGAPLTLNAQFASNIGSYIWTQIPAPVVGNSASLTITPVANVSYTLSVARADGCNSANDTVNVTTFSMPASITLSGTNCLSDSNVITATPLPAWPPAPGVFTWMKDGAAIGGVFGVEIYPSQKGSYQVTFAAGACATTSGTFALNPSPILAGIDKANCVNNATVLTASNPLASSGSSFTFLWDANPNIISGLNGQSVTVQYNTVFDTTSFNVSVSNNFGCTSEDSVYLITVEQPITTLENDTACVNTAIILSAVPTNFNVGNIPPIDDYLPTYVWTKDGVNQNVNNDTLIVTAAGQYIVNIIIGDCNNNTDTSTILFNVAPTLSLPDNTKFCDVTDSSATLSAGVTPEPNKTYLYLWSPTGDTTATITTDIPGKHYVTVTSILGSDSCDFMDSIVVRTVCSPRVHVPNVFTPGSDGPNGFFQVFGTHFSNFKMSVYNRWGEVIFTTVDANFMWDGTYRDKPMPSGVYPYIIIYDGDTEETKGPYRIEGELLLMR